MTTSFYRFAIAAVIALGLPLLLVFVLGGSAGAWELLLAMGIGLLAAALYLRRSREDKPSV